MTAVLAPGTVPARSSHTRMSAACQASLHGGDSPAARSPAARVAVIGQAIDGRVLPPVHSVSLSIVFAGSVLASMLNGYGIEARYARAVKGLDLIALAVNKCQPKVAC
jgi:hypothetical protein